MKKFILIGMAVLILSFLAGYGIIKWNRFGINPLNNQSARQPEPPSVGDQPAIDPLLEQIKNMTLDEKIGQLVVVGLDGATVDANIKDLIAQRHVGGGYLIPKEYHRRHPAVKSAQ